ncbi:MAG: ABC transporter permease, partial [Gemmatimonadaceae bacterium]|nr:ABC transporter permease [Gemmatimonadaceae bacterium]
MTTRNRVRWSPVSSPSARARQPGVWAAVAILSVIGVVAIGAPLLAPYDPSRLLDPATLRSASPSWRHPLGTDPLSRDILSRLMFGARTSLVLAASAVGVATFIGVLVGSLSAYLGGGFDRLIMRSVDVALSVPRLVVLLLFASLWGPSSVATLALVVGATGWMGVSRLVRGEVQRVLHMDHVVALRALGVTRWRLWWKHLLPSTFPIVALSISMGLGHVLLLESGLSFLGVGVPVSVPSWGPVLLDVSEVIGPS